MTTLSPFSEIRESPCTTVTRSRPCLWWSINRLWSQVFRFRHGQRAQAIFGELTDTTIVRPFFGYDLHLNVSRGITHQLVYLTGELSLPERHLVLQLVRPGMRVVDVGANIGYYLLLLERMVGKDGVVICVEPGPENLLELQVNISANGFENVEVHEVALGSREGVVGIRGGVNAGVANGADVIAEVPLRTLTRTVNGHAEFVKIDVEGYEVEVLEGAVELLRNCLPTLLVEIHPLLIPRYGSTSAKVIEILRSVYPHLVAFEKRDVGRSLWRKIASRYSLTPPLKEVDDLDSLIQRCDDGEYTLTFWVVACASESEIVDLRRKL